MMYRVICSVLVVLVLGVIALISESSDSPQPTVSSPSVSSDDKVLKGLSIN